MPQPTAPTRTSRRIAKRLALAVAVVALSGACSEDSPLSDVTLPDVTLPEGGTQPPDEAQPPEETQPPQTEPPQTEPPQTQPPQQTAPPTTAAEDSGLTDGQITTIVLLVLGLLVVALIAVWMSSRRKGTGTAAVASSQMTDLMGRARWLHDQASMEILRTHDPAQLALAWQSTRPAIVEMEGWAAGLAAGADDAAKAAALQNVQRTIAGLRGSLESDVALRSDPANADRQDLVQASAQTVQQRRAELDNALADPALRG